MDGNTIKNGTVVHRVWLIDGGMGELMAWFQFDTSAKEFADKLAKETTYGAGKIAYTATNLYDGTMTCYPTKEKQHE